MLAPPNKTFIIPAGGTLSVGQASLPGIAVHSANKVSDIYFSNAITRDGVAATSPGTNGAIFDYTGATWCPTLGAMGSFLITGGGHDAWYGNDVIRYDVATALFSRVTNPWTIFFKGAGPNFTDSTYGELFADASLTTTLQNQPGAAHGYDHGVYLAAGVDGTGSLGGLLTVRRTFTSPNAGGGTQSHILDIASGVWSRFASNRVTPVAFGGGDQPNTSVAYDTLRGKVYEIDAGWNIEVLDIATKAYQVPAVTTTGKVSGKVPAEGTFRYMAAFDLCIYCFQNGDGFAILDPANLAAGWVIPSTTGAFPGVRGGWDWDDGNKRMLYHAGDGSKNYYVLTPPATNPKTNAWAIAMQTLTGATPAVNVSGTGHQSRFRWVPALGAAIWIGSPNTNATKWTLN